MRIMPFIDLSNRAIFTGDDDDNNDNYDRSRGIMCTLYCKQAATVRSNYFIL